jgi:hypothetical protein
MELTIEQYNMSSPLFAHLDQKPEAQQNQILERYSRLSEEQQQKLASAETAEQLVTLSEQGIIPATHTKAVAAIICLVALGDVVVEQVPQLLQKLSLAPDVAQRIASAIKPLLEIPPEIKIEPLPPLPSMQPLPPLTVKIPQLPENAGADTSNRHIIDLRRQPPSA